MKAMGKRSVASFLTVLLNLGWGVLALGLALAALVLVLSPFVESAGFDLLGPGFEIGSGSSMTIPVSFSVDTVTHRVTAPSLGIENAQVLDARGSLRFPPRKGAFFYGNMVILIVLLGLGLWMVGLLRAVFRTLRDGQPFVAANATRLRWLAFGSIVSELGRSAMMFFENYYAMTYFSADGLRFVARPDLNVFAIVNALIILVIAEVFRAGTRLNDEQSLTV
jgi:hypothetical protein